MCLSDNGAEADNHLPLVRVYWNLRPDGAVPFVRALTGLLNEADLFFKFKVLNDPRAFNRCDAGVIYFYRSQYPSVASILGRVYSQVARFLKPSDAAIAHQVAEYGIERYAAAGTAWPCGTHTGETPGLMLGLSGIGHFYLRLYQPAVPSILILRKQAWSGVTLDSAEPAGVISDKSIGQSMG